MVTAENNKVDLDENEQKIINQVEYYFGDINLRNDKFMKYQMGQNAGWFPLDKLMTFNKLKAITTDSNVVVRALKKSQSGLIEFSECETKIRRIKPLPEISEEYIKQLNQRTLHLKGFPKESTFEKLQAFCSQYGNIDSLEMRKRDGNFKGCIFVVYKEQNDADKVLAIEDLKYNDIELLKENKERYYQRKKTFYELLRSKRKQPRQADVIKTEGAIMKITNVSPETKYIDIKAELTKHSKVAFVTSIDESRQCFVRFDEKDGAKIALKALREDILSSEKYNENKASEDNEFEEFSVELCGQKVKVSLVSGDEEKNYWIEFNNSRNQSNYCKKNKWQKGKKRQNEDNESPKKIAKISGDSE